MAADSSVGESDWRLARKTHTGGNRNTKKNNSNSGVQHDRRADHLSGRQNNLAASERRACALILWLMR